MLNKYNNKFIMEKLINLPKDAFELDFDFLENNRKELLNLITVEEFFEKLND
jgi:hypothetical protein